MNIDFLHDEQVVCDKHGLPAGTVLPETKYLNDLRELFVRYGITKVRVQGCFDGYRHSGVRFWLSFCDDDRLPYELLNLAETWEHVSKGADAACKQFWLTTNMEYKPEEVVWEGGEFRSNGFHALIPQHDSLRQVDVNKIKDALVYKSHYRTNTSPYDRLYDIYRAFVAIFCMENDVMYSCPEFAEVLYPDLKKFRRLCVTINSSFKHNIAFESTVFLRSGVLDELYDSINIGLRREERFDVYLLNF